LPASGSSRNPPSPENSSDDSRGSVERSLRSTCFCQRVLIGLAVSFASAAATSARFCSSGSSAQWRFSIAPASA
jgi:hypothetical protein